MIVLSKTPSSANFALSEPLGKATPDHTRSEATFFKEFAPGKDEWKTFHHEGYPTGCRLSLFSHCIVLRDYGVAPHSSTE
ncbi:hypothetical protein GCM10010361_72370 [Streptomyces olivaceiscleroticus]|uniref:Uncharacterized protein n=1 Tax=Streptomyces olivaceiscleroticus TaxID=68245 RepID=A0ABN1BEZ7_9ACTN